MASGTSGVTYHLGKLSLLTRKSSVVSSTVRLFVSAKLMMTFNPDCKVSRVELVRHDYGMSDPDLVGLSTNSPSVAVLPFYLLSWADSIHGTSHQLPNLREKILFFYSITK